MSNTKSRGVAKRKSEKRGRKIKKKKSVSVINIYLFLGIALVILLRLASKFLNRSNPFASASLAAGIVGNTCRFFKITSM